VAVPARTNAVIAVIAVIAGNADSAANAVNDGRDRSLSDIAFSFEIVSPGLATSDPRDLGLGLCPRGTE
jgi:hypothetical protein